MATELATERATMRSRIEGLVILLVALGYLWEASTVPEFYQMPGVPGPTTFPNLLGMVFALAGLWLLISPLDVVAWLRTRRQTTAEPAAEVSSEPEEASRFDWHFYAVWAVVLAYLCLMPWAGFPLATFVLIFAFMWLLGEKRFGVLFAVAFGATAVIYFAFAFGLRVRLPLGLLETLVKAGLTNA